MLLFKEERDFTLLEVTAFWVWKPALLLAPGGADLPWQLVGFTYNKKGDAETMTNYFPDRDQGKLWTWLVNFTPTSILSTKKGEAAECPHFFWLLITSECLKTQGKLPEVWTTPSEGLVCAHISWGTSRTSWVAKTMLECFNLCVPSWVTAYNRLQY